MRKRPSTIPTPEKHRARTELPTTSQSSPPRSPLVKFAVMSDAADSMQSPSCPYGRVIAQSSTIFSESRKL